MESSPSIVDTLQIALTGSIGMGKSTISSQLSKLGFPIFDADAEVHRLYSVGGKAVEPIRGLFPDAIVNESVDRSVLMKKIFENKDSLKSIEGIVHPLVAEGRRDFYELSKKEKQFMVIYDIPLFFEHREMHKVDKVIVVTANAEEQRRRVLSRPNMTPEKFDTILAKQVPDSVKRAESDYLIHTDYAGFVESKSQLCNIIEAIVEANSVLWEQWKARENPVDNPKVINEGDSLACKAFDAVVFDLDDTLAPVSLAISTAMQSLEKFMSEKMPKTCEDSKLIRETMGRIARSQPLLAHDFSELRKQALQEISKAHGEDMHVEEAMKVFLQTRSDVQDHLYPDVEACFNWFLDQRIDLGILTNGNADLDLCPLFSQKLRLKLTAADVGAAKPSPVGFIAATQLCKTVSRRVLFVGDSYEHDVIGAKKVGMVTMLILRDDLQKELLTPEEVERKYPEADIIVNSLEPELLEKKLNEFLSR